MNCLVEELDNQRRNIDDLYSGPDTKEVMTDQAFRAAIKEWEIVRDRADAILNPKINRNLTAHTDKDGLNIISSQTASQNYQPSRVTELFHADWGLPTGWYSRAAPLKAAETCHMPVLAFEKSRLELVINTDNGLVIGRCRRGLD